MIETHRSKTHLAITFFVGVFAVLLLLVTSQQSAQAQGSCPSVDTSRGTSTSTINVPASGNYRVWTRMQASSSSNDSYILQIDENICGVIVGDTSVPTNDWKWVDYQAGNTGNKINVNLTAGQHTVKLIGREDSVKVDKLLFLTDTSCEPTGFGEDCETTEDTTSPENVSITQPSNGATISGSNYIIQASATDDTGVDRVEFYIGNTLLGTDIDSPYGFGLNTTDFTDGNYQLSVIAYDAAGNQTRSDEITVTINNPVPDTTPPQVSVTSPLNNSTVSGSINVSASATDASGIEKVEILADGSAVTTLTSSPYSYSFDTQALSDGTHTITAKAYDNAGNTQEASVSVTVDNSVAPPKKADFDNDGTVGIRDLAILLSNYGKNVPVGTDGDADDNGQVTIRDLAILLSQYGS